MKNLYNIVLQELDYYFDYGNNNHNNLLFVIIQEKYEKNNID